LGVGGRVRVYVASSRVPRRDGRRREGPPASAKQPAVLPGILLGIGVGLGVGGRVRVWRARACRGEMAGGGKVHRRQQRAGAPAKHAGTESLPTRMREWERREATGAWAGAVPMCSPVDKEWHCQ
jgi:hypothetical protein